MKKPLACTLFIISLFLFYSFLENYQVVGENVWKEYNNLSGELRLPKNTRVILNISTHIDTTIDWTPSYSSKNYFYDEEGTLLDSFQIEAEMLNRYVAENQKGGVAYFMKAITMLSDQNNYTLKKQETDKKLLNITAGPSQVGYIKAKDLFYAYYNVGFMQGTYNSLIRFVSEDKNYDVFVPYSLSTISYDEEKQQFICLLDESSNEVLGGTFESYMLYFDQERQQFAGGSGSQSIPYFSYKGHTHKINRDKKPVKSHSYRVC